MAGPAKQWKSNWTSVALWQHWCLVKCVKQTWWWLDVKFQSEPDQLWDSSVSAPHSYHSKTLMFPTLTRVLLCINLSKFIRANILSSVFQSMLSLLTLLSSPRGHWILVENENPSVVINHHQTPWLITAWQMLSRCWVLVTITSKMSAAWHIWLRHQTCGWVYAVKPQLHMCPTSFAFWDLLRVRGRSRGLPRWRWCSSSLWASKWLFRSLWAMS